MNIVRRLFGYFPGCGRWFKYPRRRRQSTQYHDEESNYVTCCSDCFEEVEEHWAELWDEYYSGRL